MFLRRRGDLDLVMAQLGGELFATAGEVDKYFVSASDYCSKCNGVILKPNVNYGINPDVVCKCPSPPVWEQGLLRTELTLAEPILEDEAKEWWTKRCTPELIHKRLVARNPQIDDGVLLRIQESVEDHICSAPEREAAALLRWASGYCDGLDRALRIARHKE
jgi:hypothetical protein